MWTPEHAYIDLNNCVVNPSGTRNKWLGRDEFNEEINLLASDTNNPRDTWQSRRYHQETLPRCFMLLKELKTIVPLEAGAAFLGSRHSTVADTVDIEKIANMLVHDEVLIQKPGRGWTGRGDTRVPVDMSIDAFQEGAKDIMTGKMLRAITKKRTAKGYPEPPGETEVEDSSEADVDTQMGDGTWDGA